MEPYRHQMYVVSHCRYRRSYRKHTYIWSSIRGLSLRICGSRHPCEWLRQGWSNHNNTAKNGYDPDGRANGTPREALPRARRADAHSRRGGDARGAGSEPPSRGDARLPSRHARRTAAQQDGLRRRAGLRDYEFAKLVFVLLLVCSCSLTKRFLRPPSL